MCDKFILSVFNAKHIPGSQWDTEDDIYGVPQSVKVPGKYNITLYLTNTMNGEILMLSMKYHVNPNSNFNNAILTNPCKNGKLISFSESLKLNNQGTNVEGVLRVDTVDIVPKVPSGHVPQVTITAWRSDTNPNEFYFDRELRVKILNSNIIF